MQVAQTRSKAGFHGAPVRRKQVPGMPVGSAARIGTRPLVTFFVAAYNQEHTVRAAVEGAFAQTYQPLEVMLSDDGSQDGTFAIMQQMAAAYRGPHRVLLNRNPENLGIPRHVDRIMELTRGAFVVQNAGDDISLPERTETLVAHWQADAGRIRAIHSAKCRIDGAGRNLGRADDRNPVNGHRPLDLLTERASISGASMGWDRRVFDVFGPLGGTPVFEDYPICLRAATLGDVVYLDTPLLHYRTGGLSSPSPESMGFYALYGHRLRWLAWHLSFNRLYLHDMDTAAPPDDAACREHCLKNIRDYSCEIDLAGMTHAERLAALPGAALTSLREGDATVLRKTAKYAFDRPYMAWLTWRGGSVGAR